MDIINPETPVYNAIIFYIMIVCIILTIKPKFMYCDKNKKFKSFGFGNNKTILSFPVICVSSGIILYLIFLSIKILFERLAAK